MKGVIATLAIASISSVLALPSREFDALTSTSAQHCGSRPNLGLRGGGLGHSLVLSEKVLFDITAGFGILKVNFLDAVTKMNTIEIIC